MCGILTLRTVGRDNLDNGHPGPQYADMGDWIETLTFSSRRGGPTPRPKASGSPYYDKSAEECIEITRKLLKSQPLAGNVLRDAVLDSWKDIFESTIGVLKIGATIFPTPQIMGWLLHELVPARLAQELPDWRRDSNSAEKDLVYIPDPQFSIEIKTSSNVSQIFGNRSFGIESTKPGKKAKSGYYCAINFQRWQDADNRPSITAVRYGWLDSTDWVAQKAETGQQSALPSSVYNTQLPLLYSSTAP